MCTYVPAHVCVCIYVYECVHMFWGEGLCVDGLSMWRTRERAPRHLDDKSWALFTVDRERCPQ